MGEPGSVLTSDHYVIRTTCRHPRFVHVLPVFVETCYASYARLLSGKMTSAKRMETYLFQSRRQWERFTEQFSPRRANTYKLIRRGGYSERGITVSHYSRQASTLSILAHEGLHQYLTATGRDRIPAWINEGLACYFESFDLDLQNRPTPKPEKNALRRPALRKAVATGTLLPLREVLATNAGLAVQQRSSQVQTCYAQWWSLMVFLLRPRSENPYYSGFHELLGDLGTEAMNRRAKAYLAADTAGTLTYGEAVFRAYITEDLDRFEAAYKAYLHKLLDLKVF